MDCPECGSATVATDLDADPGSDIPPTLSITDAILKLAESEAIGVTRRCWECGWRETRTVKVAAVDVESGDESVVERRRLIEEVTAEVEQIDENASLREVLATTERVRQQESTHTHPQE